MAIENVEYKINDRWVWVGSYESVRNHQWSVVAIIESTLVCAGLWTLAWRFPQLRFFAHYSLIVAAITAPVLLMKSDQSVALGVSMMRRYWTPSPVDTWSGAKWYEQLLLSILFAFVSFGYSTIAYESLIQEYGSHWSNIIAVFTGVFIGGALVTSLKGDITLHTKSPFVIRLPFVACILGAAIAVGWLHASYISFVLSVIPVWLWLEGVLWAMKHNGNGFSIGKFQLRKNFFALCFAWVASPIYLTGLVIRVLFIRICATFLYPLKGLRNIPNNWADNFARIDIRVPAALVPDGESVSDQISTSAMRKIMFTRGNIVIRAIAFFGFVICFVPSLLYRWSLKGTLWAWWPMAVYLFSIRTEVTDDERLNNVRLIISRANKTLLTLISGTALSLLSLTTSFNNPTLANIVGIVPEAYRKLATELKDIAPVSALGLHWWAIMSLVFVPIILWISSSELIVLFKKEIEDRSISKMSFYNRELFHRYGERIQFLWVTFIFCVLEAIWWTCLAKAQLKFGSEFPFTILPEWLHL